MAWLTVKEYAAQFNVSEKTVYRRIGDRTLTAQKLGRLWRIEVRAVDTFADFDDGTHQSFLKDLLDDAALELGRLRNRFPTVWRLSFRPEDPANSLERNRDGEIEWSLSVEREWGWKYVAQHLRTGMVHTIEALTHAKESFCRYCHRLVVIEDHYRLQVENLCPQKSGILVNESQFYRSIIECVDPDTRTPDRADYSKAHREDRVDVILSGALLFDAKDAESAEFWTGKHLLWRQQCLGVYKSSLTRFRGDFDAAAGTFISAVEELKAGRRVPGTCEMEPSASSCDDDSK